MEPADYAAFAHPDPEVRMSWAWHWSEILWGFQNDHPVTPWMAIARGLDPTVPVLPAVLPIRGAS